MAVYARVREAGVFIAFELIDGIVHQGLHRSQHDGLHGQQERHSQGHPQEARTLKSYN